MKYIAAIFLTLAFISGCSDKTEAPSSTKTQTAPDFIDSIINKYFSAVSGKGEKNWELLRILCDSNIRFNAMGIDEQGKNVFHTMDLNGFIEHMDPYLEKHGFYQTAVHRVTEYYNKIAHAFITYESRNEASGEIIDKGILSFQLMQLHDQWKIMNIMLNSATIETPLPEKYLPNQ